MGNLSPHTILLHNVCHRKTIHKTISHHTLRMLSNYLWEVKRSNLMQITKVNLQTASSKKWNVFCHMAEWIFTMPQQSIDVSIHCLHVCTKRSVLLISNQLQCQLCSGPCHAKHVANAASVHQCYALLDNAVQGHSRSSKLVQIKSPHATSY